MDDLFEGFPEEVTKWDVIRDIIDLDLDDEKSEPKKQIPTDQLLPRQDVMVYGIIPKMEQSLYIKCKECKLVFNPRNILSHKICPGKSHSSPTIHSSKKKVKNKGGSASKKSHSSLPPPPLFKKSSSSPSSSVSSTASPEISPTKPSLPKLIKVPSTSSPSTTNSSPSTFSKLETKLSSGSESSKSNNSVYSSPKSPKHSSKSDHSPKLSSKTVSNSNSSAYGTSTGHSSSHSSSHTSSSHTSSSHTSSSHSSAHSSSSRHKKSRRSNSNTKINKEFDPDVHCGVIEGSKGPCTRSITCSNHRIQLRKLVPGRSKDIHQLIAEKKTSKEKDTKNGHPSPNGPEEKDFLCQSTSYVPLAETIASTIESATTPSTAFVTTKCSDLTSYSRQTTSLLNDKDWKTNMEYCVCFLGCCMDLSNCCRFTDPDLKLAACPPVTTNTPTLVSIVNHNSNVEMYESHPKPIAVPSYATRKVGGAILRTYHRIESQRNDLLAALNNRPESINNPQGYQDNSLLNHTNTPYRPNILKVRSANKVNCKRPANDKINTSESKQIRLTNVNGFILHSDLSESADAPQTNNCIQGKIALLDMK